VITETEAQTHTNTHVTLTLVDGTKVKGYLATVGYQGLRLMVHGRTSEWRFSAIETITPKSQP
jgi:hypothetical protein